MNQSAHPPIAESYNWAGTYNPLQQRGAAQGVATDAECLVPVA